MMPGFLTARLAGPIASGIAALLLVGLAYVLIFVVIPTKASLKEVRGQLTTAQADLRNARDDLTQCRSNRITLEEATRRQNEAVEKVRTESAARIAELGKAAARAEASAAEARRTADRIMAVKGTGNVCADADALILGEVK